MQDGHGIKTNNSSFERVEEFKYLGTTFTHQNSIHGGCLLSFGAEPVVFQFAFQKFKD